MNRHSTDCGSDVILNCGGLPLGTIKQLAAVADQSLLVVRACYLTLRRCTGTGIATTGIVLVKEHGRALRTCDVEAALGRPIVAEIPICPNISRASDAGLLQALHTRSLPALDLIGTDCGLPIG